MSLSSNSPILLFDFLLTFQKLFLILDKHLIEMRHIPHPSISVQREICLLHPSPLQSPILHRAIGYATLQAIGTGHYRKVCKADL